LLRENVFGAHFTLQPPEFGSMDKLADHVFCQILEVIAVQVVDECKAIHLIAKRERPKDFWKC
jgi:hypothetical protein